MATISERLAYVLTFDTSSGIKSVEKFGKTADKELSKADKKLDKLGSNMTKFGAGAMAFAGIAGVGLAKMAQGAADADANMSALEQVVGTVAAAEIGKWAENSAKGVGMASKAAVEASTQFAGLGKIIGLADKPLADFAQSHVELAADMAAFKNVAPEQAVQDLAAAYAGSTEVLRKYNIFLDERTLKEAYARETGEKVTGTLSTQQKIIAINAELYRQSADMMGQWGRESGELSGQQATLRAELTNLSDNIGAGVLPMLVSVMGVATKVTGALSSMSPEAQATAGRFVALGVAGIGLIGTLSMVAGQAIKMRDRFIDAEGALNRTGKAAKGVGIAMGVASLALIAYSLHAMRAERHSNQLTTAIDNISRATEDEMIESLAHTIRVFSELRDKSPEDVFKDMAAENLGAAIKIRDTALASGELNGQLSDLGLTTDVLTGIIDDETAAQQRSAAAQLAATDAVQAGTEATDDLGDATDDVEESVTKTTRALNEHERAIARVANRYERMRGELSNRSAYLSAQEGLAALAFQAETTGDVTEQQIIDMKNDLLDYGLTLDDEAGKSRVAKLVTDLDQDSFWATAIALEKLERNRTVRIMSKYVGGYDPKGGIDGDPATPWHTGGIVGERRFTGLRDDEVPAILQKGEAVLTKGQQAAMLGGGGGGNTIINNYPAGWRDADDIENGRRRYERIQGPM